MHIQTYTRSLTEQRKLRALHRGLGNTVLPARSPWDKVSEDTVSASQPCRQQASVRIPHRRLFNKTPASPRATVLEQDAIQNLGGPSQGRVLQWERKITT